MGRLVLFPTSDRVDAPDLEMRRTAAAALVCRLDEERLAVLEALLPGLSQIDGPRALAGLRAAVQGSFAEVLTDALGRFQS